MFTEEELKIIKDALKSYHVIRSNHDPTYDNQQVVELMIERLNERKTVFYLHEQPGFGGESGNGIDKEERERLNEINNKIERESELRLPGWVSRVKTLHLEK